MMVGVVICQRKYMIIQIMIPVDGLMRVVLTVGKCGVSMQVGIIVMYRLPVDLLIRVEEMGLFKWNQENNKYTNGQDSQNDENDTCRFIHEFIRFEIYFPSGIILLNIRALTKKTI